MVAPLNLSTTVEGSLVGLRESLVTLSAALESQGRRLDLALTTEGLRVNEEVGSLKAVVQGLRMQVSLCDSLAHLRFSADRDLLFGRALSVYLGTPAFACRFILQPCLGSPLVNALCRRAHANHFVFHVI